MFKADIDQCSGQRDPFALSARKFSRHLVQVMNVQFGEDLFYFVIEVPGVKLVHGLAQTLRVRAVDLHADDAGQPRVAEAVAHGDGPQGPARTSDPFEQLGLGEPARRQVQLIGLVEELYGPSEQTVTIGPKETKTVTFTFKATAAGD